MTKEAVTVDNVAQFPERDRRDLFTSVSSERGDMSPLIVEKDFWVCWCLKHLFSISWDVGMIFKGGTSLSKAYGLIRRFSEDVDLSLDRQAMGFTGDREPLQAPSGKQAKRLLDELSAACESFVAETLLPTFQSEAQSVLGSATSSRRWSLSIDEKDKGTVLFAYPSVVATSGNSYIRQMVRLEIGARADHWPSHSRPITPYAAEILPQAFKEAGCEVQVLSAARTFWEKATILHALYHKPLDKALGDRQSRHYSDLAIMADTDAGREALGDPNLLDAVARHKAVFFRSRWAHYDTARIGTLRLLPPEQRRNELKQDYNAMAEMFFDEPEPFDEVMHGLGKLEALINSGQVS